MSNPIGIMQGRLTASPSGVLQEFPLRGWRKEFDVARALGFQSIEWLFDTPDGERNPLFSAAGRERIIETKGETGVEALSVCAHYFIEGQLTSSDAAERAAGIDVASQLIANASEVGAGIVVLPFGEGASVQGGEARSIAVESLRSLADSAGSKGVRLALELDIDAEESAGMIEALDSAAIGICYDLGNATAAGLDASAELIVLAPFLFEVHVKDRPAGGPNVPLGEGAVDFLTAFQSLSSINYDGPLTLETIKGDMPVEMGERHIIFVKDTLVRAGLGARA